MRIRSFLLFLPVLLLLSGACPYAGGKDDMTVLWFPKEPLYRMVDGRPGGLLLPLAERILEEAGFHPKFVRMPLRRVMMTLRDCGCPNILGLGWYRTPERELWTRFSLPIYRDGPFTVMIRREDAKRYENLGTFTELAAVAGLRMGVVAGYSYGTYLDSVMQDRATKQVAASRDGQLCGMLEAHRCDCIIGPQRNLEEDLLSQELPLQNFTFLRFRDMPQGSLRYLVFTRETSPQTMERVNAAILKVVGDLR